MFERLSERVAKTMMRKKLFGFTITIKVRYFDFSTVTRSVTVQSPVQSSTEITQHIPKLLKATEAGRKSIRLLGLAVAKLSDASSLKPRQLQLPFMHHNNNLLSNPDSSSLT